VVHLDLTETAAVRTRRDREHRGSVRLGVPGVGGTPPHSTEDAIIKAARGRSIGPYGMDAFRFAPAPTSPQLVVGYGNVSASALQSGIAAIRDLLGRPHKTI
jgi:hypothetical protein